VLARTLAIAVGLLGATSALADPPAPVAADLVAANLHEFRYTNDTLSGPGAAFLREATAHSQFVLLGEDHMDHATPVFAGALFRMLHADHGFRYLVVEQDPLAIEDALEPPARGNVERSLGSPGAGPASTSSTATRTSRCSLRSARLSLPGRRSGASSRPPAPVARFRNWSTWRPTRRPARRPRRCSPPSNDSIPVLRTR